MKTVVRIAETVFPIVASIIAERYKDSLGVWLWVIFTLSGIALLHAWGVLDFVWKMIPLRRREAIESRSTVSAPLAPAAPNKTGPTIYVAELLDESHLHLPASPIVLHNRGDEVAHAIQILPVTVGYREILFDYVDTLAVDEKKKVLPRIAAANGASNTSFFYLLKRELDAKNKAQQPSESIQLPLTIIYKNRSQTRHFETSVEISYFPIRREISEEWKKRKVDDWPHGAFPWYEVRHDSFKATP